MADSSDSDLSSVPPSPEHEHDFLDSISIPSSPLSSAPSSPEPPENWGFDIDVESMARKPPGRVVIRAGYPSPPSSQQTSLHGSPTPDGVESGIDGPPPAKRRRISKEPKERTTEYIDLRSGTVDEEDQEHLDRVLNALHKRQKIVVIAGAGMSKSAGVPDFRSKQGLFCTLKKEHNLKGSGQHLFDASVYKDDASTEQFHSMISQMSRLTKDAKPTPFHHMLATIAKEDRLLRLYSQNVDCLETNMEPLRTRTPLTKDENGKWPRTVQLHGGLDKMICTKCHEITNFDPNLFDGSDAPLCPTCDEIDDIRTTYEGKRSHGVGRLRPRMVLYHEQGFDEAAIGAVSVADLKRKPDAVVVVGTTMKVKGLQRLVKEMCGVVRDRKDGGLVIWINPDAPPASQGFRDCFDIIVQGTCDDVANKAAMRKWDEPALPDDYSEVSDEDAAKAAAKRAKVVLPSCHLTHANVEKLPSSQHRNNSFPPPDPEATSVKSAELRPLDWSPVSSRRTSIPVLRSIEMDPLEGENIKVSQSTGLPTPSRSKQSTPAKVLPIAKAAGKANIFAGLKDTGASKSMKAPAKSSKSTANAKKTAASIVKGVKPSKGKASSKFKPQQSTAKSQAITNAFRQSKSAATVAKNSVAKKDSSSSPAKSPSKLRKVSNASANEPMAPLSQQDAKVNKASLRGKTPTFSHGATENANTVVGVKRKSVST